MVVTTQVAYQTNREQGTVAIGGEEAALASFSTAEHRVPLSLSVPRMRGREARAVTGVSVYRATCHFNALR